MVVFQEPAFFFFFLDGIKTFFKKRERAKEKERERKRGNAEPARGHGKPAHGGEAATRWQCYPVVGALDAAQNWTGGFG